MIGASIGYPTITVASFFIMYYYAKKFKILKFELVKITEIYSSGFVMFLIIVALQRMPPTPR
jgi:O-antigen/teichoic acid export membrane protein